MDTFRTPDTMRLHLGSDQFAPFDESVRSPREVEANLALLRQVMSHHAAHGDARVHMRAFVRLEPRTLRSTAASGSSATQIHVQDATATT